MNDTKNNLFIRDNEVEDENIHNSAKSKGEIIPIVKEVQKVIEVQLDDKTKVRMLQKRGGGGRGQGRPVGTKNIETVLKQRAMTLYRKRVAKITDKLLNSELSLAIGTVMLFKIVKEKDEKGHEHNSKPILVDNQREIEEFLQNKNAADTWVAENGDEYYFLTSVKPDSNAIKNILDRVYGKAAQNINIGGQENNPVEITPFSKEQRERMAKEIIDREKEQIEKEEG